MINERLTDSVPDDKHALIKFIARICRLDNLVLACFLVPAVTLSAMIRGCGVSAYTSSTRLYSNLVAWLLPSLPGGFMASDAGAVFATAFVVISFSTAVTNRSARRNSTPSSSEVRAGICPSTGLLGGVGLCEGEGTAIQVISVDFIVGQSGTEAFVQGLVQTFGRCYGIEVHVVGKVGCERIER